VKPSAALVHHELLDISLVPPDGIRKKKHVWFEKIDVLGMHQCVPEKIGKEIGKG